MKMSRKTLQKEVSFLKARLFAGVILAQGYLGRAASETLGRAYP